MPSSISEIWPVFQLKVEIADLVLIIPTDDELVELAVLAGRGIQKLTDPVQFQMEWLYLPTTELQRKLTQFYWKRRAEFSADNWALCFVAYRGDQLIGVQDLFALDFVKKRVATTGSWVGLEFQGKGYGTSMRQAVLELAFNHLGASEVRTDYIDGNLASRRVSEKLGYESNGYEVVIRGGKPIKKHLMVLAKENYTSDNGVKVRNPKLWKELIGL